MESQQIQIGYTEIQVFVNKQNAEISPNGNAQQSFSYVLFPGSVDKQSHNVVEQNTADHDEHEFTGAPSVKNQADTQQK